MKDLLKLIAPRMRELGFKGSGQYFRRSEDDFVFLVNFQSSRSSEVFFINLGAQPTFIPAEGDAERGAHNLGLVEKTMELATHGLSIAGERAVLLIADLRSVVDECAVAKAQPKVPADAVGAAEPSP